MTKQTVFERLEEERVRRDLNKTQWSDWLGVTTGTYNNWRARDAGVPPDEALRIRKKLRWSYERMFDGGSDTADRLVRVPVLGEARLGDGGYFNETAYEAPDGYVLDAKADDDAYALRCKGDSMWPAIKAGDFVIISPKRRVELGDLVMCQTTDGRRMIKNLSRRRDGMTEFTSLNNAFNPITLDEDEIAHLYFADGPIKARYHEPAAG